ncbi:MAG: hypothetical protein IJW40_00645 [Clostridia bacterium]|nr:hypothetical protein [Clostridia bacterium]
MKHIRLISVSLVLLLCLVWFAGCTGQAPDDIPATENNAAQDSPATPDPYVLYQDTDTATVTTAMESITPNMIFLWAESYDAATQQWSSADGGSAIDHLTGSSTEELAALPAVTESATLTISLPRDMTLNRLSCYQRHTDGDFPLIGNAENVTQMRSLLQDLHDGEYYILMNLTKQGEYIESEEKHESSGYGVYFRYIYTAPHDPAAPSQGSVITIEPAHNDQVLFWTDVGFTTPTEHMRWSEGGGMFFDAVYDPTYLERVEKLVPDQLLCLTAGEALRVELPGNTTYTGYTVYSRNADGVYSRQELESQHVTDALSLLSQGEWFVGLDMKFSTSSYAMGYTVYFKYLVK